MELIAKIFGVGMVVVTVEISLRASGREDIAFWVRMAALVTIMFWVIPEIAKLFTTVQTLFQI